MPRRHIRLGNLFTLQMLPRLGPTLLCGPCDYRELRKVHPLPSPTVRALMLYGKDNPVDGTVLRVILRKAERIRKELGVAVPLPADNNKVVDAIMKPVLLQAQNPPEPSTFHPPARNSLHNSHTTTKPSRSGSSRGADQSTGPSSPAPRNGGSAVFGDSNRGSAQPRQAL